MVSSLCQISCGILKRASVIDADLALRQQFKKSSWSLSSKKANEGFILITAPSAEILAIGLTGWASGTRRRTKKAKALLAEYAQAPGLD
jgi:hypothetical protein